jgi:PPM family protein phosphatase
MRIVFSAKTDTGVVRKENQDSYGISEGKNIYFLCDGMGGGAAGDFASRCASEIILKSIDILKKDEINNVAPKFAEILQYELLPIVVGIRLANRALLNLSIDYPLLAGMGTTLTAVYFDPAYNIMHIFHVGDSRVYRIRNGVLELLTKDHSKVNELLEQGKMKEEEVKMAEIQSMITRALGTAKTVKIDYRPEYVKNDDCFLLCTDGLNGELDDNEIRSNMAENKTNLDLMVTKLINAANHAGGRDNTTVIALKAYEDVKQSDIYPHDSRIGKVITLEDETPEESKAEDRLLKKLMSDSNIKIPKSARQRSVASNPLILGAIIALLVVLVALYLPKFTGEHGYDTHLSDLAGKVTGLLIDVREPTPAQYQIFKKSDDTVTKLEIIQDWYRGNNQYTLPLKNVNLSISIGRGEKFQGMTTDVPLEIKLEGGSFVIRLHRQGYKLITRKMEITDSVNVSIESSSNYMPLTLIMIPAD